MVTMAVLVGVAAAALAQAPPSLSTAEVTALQALENQKGDADAAKKAADERIRLAQQAERKIEMDFAQAHAGWQINPQTLTVEKAAAPVGPAGTSVPPVPPPSPKGAK